MDLKRAVGIIVFPLAVATSVLLLVLSMLEFWRRGFVSLFIDLRTVVIVTLVLWLVSVLTDEEQHRRRSWLVMIIVTLLACLPILWTLTAPFGRLGLLTFGIGIFVMILILTACLKIKPKT